VAGFVEGGGVGERLGETELDAEAFLGLSTAMKPVRAPVSARMGWTSRESQ
jgi:hypothetical protein